MPGPFCKLADPAGYVACPWDLSVDAAGRTYWVGLFLRHSKLLLKLGIDAAVGGGEDFLAAQARADACREEFFACFEAFAADPGSYGTVTILTLDRWRDPILRKHGFIDVFAPMKDRENTAAVLMLPKVCRELDGLPERRRMEAVIRGVFAGNIFDMGSEAVAGDYLGAGRDFFKTRDGIPPRPWLIDDYERFEKRMLEGPRHRKAVYFIDNAGSDFMLGALPMMRWLCLRGTQVVLAANERPTLNDMTIEEVRGWWPIVTTLEPSLGDVAIQCVSTGTGEPLIDLNEVSEELNEAAADADLVILEGMGRGVESNLEARFSCDSLNLAMIKDQEVAARHGGRLFDVVCRFKD